MWVSKVILSHYRNVPVETEETHCSCLSSSRAFTVWSMSCQFWGTEKDEDWLKLLCCHLVDVTVQQRTITGLLDMVRYTFIDLWDLSVSEHLSLTACCTIQNNIFGFREISVSLSDSLGYIYIVYTIVRHIFKYQFDFITVFFAITGAASINSCCVLCIVLWIHELFSCPAPSFSWTHCTHFSKLK